MLQRMQDPQGIASVNPRELEPSDCQLIAEHIRRNPGMADEETAEGKEYRVELQKGLLALDDVARAAELRELQASGVIRRGQQVSREENMHMLLQMMLAVRFACSRARPQLSRMFACVLDGIIPRPVAKLAKDTQVIVPSAAVLSRRQVSLCAAFCDFHRQQLNRDGGEVYLVCWADASVQARRDLMLSCYDWCHGSELPLI